MSNLQNKIEAHDQTIRGLLKDQKFHIDYFQREYRWEKKHIVSLIEDLTAAFLKSYDSTHKPEEVANYQSYYLGPVVFSLQGGKNSIIDGQQRITSLSLLLIYLRHLQKKHLQEDRRVSVDDLVYSTKHQKKSFNMTDKTREPCLQSLYENGSYEVKEEDDETVNNMVDRYEDIAAAIPDELTNAAFAALPYFVDWLLEKVVIVKITAHSDENAYIIFETMNDRGLNLTSSEMLKGYVLSKISDPEQRKEIDGIWKKGMQKLHKYTDATDQIFFQSWFRGKYAERMRPSKAGSKNQDFELIGSRFHSWFKDNHERLFKLEESGDFYNFFKEQFPFYVGLFTRILDAQEEYDPNIPHLHYVHYWGIAESLRYPLLLAPINFGDKAEEKIIQKKLDFAARYIETFTIKRAVNRRNFGHSSIKDRMFRVVKSIRNNSLGDLATNLSTEVESIEQKLDAVAGFELKVRNRAFAKHLLSRVSAYVDELAGKSMNYVSYHHPTTGKPFEIEHIWGDNFDDYKEEFEQKEEFQIWRNSIGALMLLPNGTNQSFGGDKYECKLKHYLKENTYAQTLHEKFYEKNPNFLRPETIERLGFQPHPQFKKKDIEERCELVKRICEELWSTEYFRP